MEKKYEINMALDGSWSYYKIFTPMIASIHFDNVLLVSVPLFYGDLKTSND